MSAANGFLPASAGRFRFIFRQPICGVFLAVALTALLLGGSSNRYPLVDFLVQGVALLGLCIALLAGWWRPVLTFPRHVQLLLAGIVFLPIAHLVPLPTQIWEHLAGRSLPSDILQAAGISHAWHSLSLAPDETRFAFLALLPAMTGFLLMLSLPENSIRPILTVILAVIFLSALIGMFQVASAGRIFPFYENFYAGSSNGVMANRNHHADVLIIGMLLLTLWRKRRGAKHPITLPLAVGGLFLLASILATQSRTGIVLAIGALLAQAVHIFRPDRGSIGRYLVAASLVVIALTGLYLANDRVGEIVGRYAILSQDLRVGFWKNAFGAAWQYFPVGSGIGSFDKVFPAHEALDLLGPVFVNAAHNDYLELLMTGGLPAMLITALLIGAIVVAARRLRQSVQDSRQRDLTFVATTGLVVFLVHSCFDYPLQTHAVNFLFACFLALLFRFSYLRAEVG